MKYEETEHFVVLSHTQYINMPMILPYGCYINIDNENNQTKRYLRIRYEKYGLVYGSMVYNINGRENYKIFFETADHMTKFIMEYL